MAHWMLTADQQLLNLDAVEYFEVFNIYPEDAEPEAVTEGRVQPVYAELIAHLGSADEVVMFDDEDADAVFHAFELLKSYLLNGAAIDALHGGGPLSVQDLIDRAGAQKN